MTQRVIDAVASVNADLVVEIIGNCPIIDPEIEEQVIHMFNTHQADYVNCALVCSYSDAMDAQAFHLETLKRSVVLMNDRLDCQHFVLNIWNHPELFYHFNVVSMPEIHWPELGPTLDEHSDYELPKRIIEHFEADHPLFSYLDAVRFLRQFPEFVENNKDVVRKGNN